MKRKISPFSIALIILSLLLLYQNVWSQKKQQLDSLKKTISSNVIPEERAKAYNGLSINYYNINLDTAIKYATQSIEFSSKHNLYITLAIGHNYLGQFMYAKGNYQLSLSNFEKFKLAAIKGKNERLLLQAVNNMANVYLDLGKTDEAIKSYEEVLSVSKSKKYKKELAMAYGNLSYVYRYIGNYQKAIAYLFEEIKINEDLAYQSGLAYAYQQLALIYIQKKDTKDAKQYLDLSFEKFKSLNDIRNMAISYNLYATYYFEGGNLTKAIEYGNMAINLASKAKDKRSLAIFQNKLAEMYYDKEQYELAKNTFQMSISLHEEIDLQKTIASPYIGYGKTLLRLKDYQNAKNNIQKGLAIAIKQKSITDKKNAYEGLAEYYIKTNNADLALKNQKIFNELKDSLLNENNNKQLNELHTIYNTEKKEAQISLLSKENSIKALELKNNLLEIGRNKSLIKQQQQDLIISDLELKNKNQIVANQKLDAKQKAQSIKTLQKQAKIQNLEIANKGLELKQRNYTISAILFAFVAIGGFSFSYYKRQQLKQENRLQSEIFKQQEVATKAVFDGEQQERIRIARDLHDSIGQMLSVVKMNLSSAKDNQDPTMQLVDKTIAEVRNISHNLIPEELNFGLFNAIEDICDKINAAGDTTVFFEVGEHISDIKFSKQNELSIYRIVQEVLGNMIKHAQASEIKLDIEQQLSNIIISIKDNGKGFDASKINESKGLGWKNISARVHLLDGKMNIHSERLSGTKIEISIPEQNA